MAEGDRTETTVTATQDELTLNELEACSVSSTDLSASDPSIQSAETEPRESPVINILSNLIIQRYEGGMCGELFHGEGVACFRGGHVYKGSFVDGFMHGQGEYTWADGVKYEGNFESNTLMGHGTYTWLDSSTYEGEVCNGVCHGTGTYKSAKMCTVYIGQWHNGKRHGKGTMHYNQEATSWYQGDWKNNQKEGWGMRCYPSGDMYEGQWKNSVRHGEGTMKWIQLGQQYKGQWLNGVQHGCGTHTWFLRHISSSQYPLRKEYKGEFAQGMRHGQGTFIYSSGAVYSGCWKDNKKHGQGKFFFKNGRIYDGEFIDDNMVECPASSTISECALGDIPSKVEVSGNTEIALNIEALLNRFPEAQRKQELRQVEFAVMRHITLLRSIYSLYSSLGYENSPDYTFLLNHLQFCRFLKDCSVYQHGLTLAQLEHLINKDVSPGEVHLPFSAILLRKWFSCIVTAAYHIYHKEFESSSYVLAECFSKLMRQNIIPNAHNVKGSFYCHPLCAVIGNNYIERCWEIYHTVPKVISADFCDNRMTARHFIWMFKGLGLFDNTLTIRRLLEILSQENPLIYSSVHINLDLEITFLEFFEALLDCAEVKNTHGDETAESRPCDLDCPDENLPEDQMTDSPTVYPFALSSPQQNMSTVLSSGTMISSDTTREKSIEEFKSKETPQSTVSEEIKYKDQGTDLSMLDVTNTSKMDLNETRTSSALVEDTQVTNPPCMNAEVIKEEQLENGSSHIHQFFTHTFFPAFEHNMLWKNEMQEEDKRRIIHNRLMLEKAKDNAKLREQQRAEEEERAREMEKIAIEQMEEEERSLALYDPNNSSTTVSVTSSSSAELKQSPTVKKKKRK